jgi:hypothetical protein
MKRLLSRWIFRLRMSRFPKAPVHPVGPDGRFISRRLWRAQQMRGGL